MRDHTERQRNEIHEWRWKSNGCSISIFCFGHYEGISRLQTCSGSIGGVPLTQGFIFAA
jgi:hypothetical protein